MDQLPPTLDYTKLPSYVGRLLVEHTSDGLTIISPPRSANKTLVFGSLFTVFPTLLLIGALCSNDSIFNKFMATVVLLGIILFVGWAMYLAVRQAKIPIVLAVRGDDLVVVRPWLFDRRAVHIPLQRIWRIRVISLGRSVALRPLGMLSINPKWRFPLRLFAYEDRHQLTLIANELESHRRAARERAFPINVNTNL